MVGLHYLWQDPVVVHVESFSINHVDVLVQQEGRREWRFTGVYGHPQDEHKHTTVELLE